MTSTTTPAPRAHSSALAIDRRSLLGAAPVIAAAVALPAIALAAAPSTGWAAAKAAYRSATAAADELFEQYGKADKAAVEALQGPGPERRISYTEPGFKVGPVTLDPHETTRTLTLRDLAEPDEVLNANPDFLAWRAEAEAWTEQRAEYRRQFRVDELFEAWGGPDGAFDRRAAAWRAMLAYPVATLAEVAEKIEVAMPFTDGEDHDKGTMLDAVTADLRRLAGEA